MILYISDSKNPVSKFVEVFNTSSKAARHKINVQISVDHHQVSWERDQRHIPTHNSLENSKTSNNQLTEALKDQDSERIFQIFIPAGAIYLTAYLIQGFVLVLRNNNRHLLYTM